MYLSYVPLKCGERCINKLWIEAKPNKQIRIKAILRKMVDHTASAAKLTVPVAAHDQNVTLTQTKAFEVTLRDLGILYVTVGDNSSLPDSTDG